MVRSPPSKTVGYYKREGQRPSVTWRSDADERAPPTGFPERVQFMALFAHENREIYEIAGEHIYSPRPVVAHCS